ncbi:hypothetical protein EV386_2910 [Xylanimonas ulmi]|uniref:Uncharacterized protein n=1 Tax=Xylanimonas ulmi TaxID=228973 RepID=A0A4Q7M679_9MICO|nr:hypothetical protein EV386_2910 [Xylanibacterium ulmi]
MGQSDDLSAAVPCVAGRGFVGTRANAGPAPVGAGPARVIGQWSPCGPGAALPVYSPRSETSCVSVASLS